MSHTEDLTALQWEANMCAGLSAVIDSATRNTVASYMRPEYARLMAAAPELLAIAIRFLDLYGAGGPEHAFDSLEEACRCAIDKVSGSEEG